MYLFKYNIIACDCMCGCMRVCTHHDVYTVDTTLEEYPRKTRHYPAGTCTLSKPGHHLFTARVHSPNQEPKKGKEGVIVSRGEE